MWRVEEKDKNRESVLALESLLAKETSKVNIYWRKTENSIPYSAGDDRESRSFELYISENVMMEESGALRGRPAITNTYNRSLLHFPIIPTMERYERGLNDDESGGICFTVKKVSERVIVPAGKFEDCLEVIGEVKRNQKIKDENNSIDLGWKTYTYYCPTVGLVKQYQEDLKGKQTYILELQKYATGQKK